MKSNKSENRKYPQKIPLNDEIDSLHFTSFLAWTFLTFLAHYAQRHKNFL